MLIALAHFKELIGLPLKIEDKKIYHGWWKTIYVLKQDMHLLFRG
jgi:hypothetical protein